MKNVLSIAASALVFGLAGCSLYSTEADKRSATENAETSPEEKSSSGSAKKPASSSSGGAERERGEPTTSIAYKGPFVIGDGTIEDGDDQCQSSLGVKTSPNTGALEFPLEIQGVVTELTVKASKLCGAEFLYAADLLLVKDGVTVLKEELKFADSPDVARDTTITFESETKAGFEPGEYSIVLAAQHPGVDETKFGAFNDFAVGSLDVGVIGEGKLVQLGDPDASARSEVSWDDTFSVGDNVFTGTDHDEAAETACRSNLGAGPAKSTTHRVQIEIGGDVTDLAFAIDKTCGGDGLYEAELRIYEGDNLLLIKREGGYSTQDQVISSVLHANAENVKRPLKPGVYTLEFAAHEDDDASASGLSAWVVGKNATIKKH